MEKAVDFVESEDMKLHLLSKSLGLTVFKCVHVWLATCVIVLRRGPTLKVSPQRRAAMTRVLDKTTSTINTGHLWRL
jgi:hypothetical protein